ncbi:MAG: hypothetical protein LBK95_01045 [Bifidobacteriaceae bacterium]|jgi:hypothetical protein|nr:hypothetical protein [Bifidobacteriaceae bacterium]
MNGLLAGGRGIIARRSAVAVVALCVSLGVLAGCRPSGVEGAALDFTEEDLSEDGGWDRTGLPERWVQIATSDRELKELLAGTATVPPLPQGQTALLYYVGGGSPGITRYEVTGVYSTGEEWTLAVHLEATGHIGLTIYQSSRFLVFVDAPAPKTVNLRFEDRLGDGDPEVTWW